MADIIFLPEAHEKSGSLITVDIGRKLGKTIYAPMGSILSPSSQGSNSYIAGGIITPLDHLHLFLAKHFSLQEEKEETDVIPGCILTPQQQRILDFIRDQ